MSMTPFKGFVGSSYTLKNARYDCQRTVNLYPEVDETGLGKNAEIAQLTRTPGLQLLTYGPTTYPLEQGLCMYHASNGIIYMATTDGLWSITNTPTGWASAKLGRFPPNGGYASDFAQMTDNTQQLFITTNGLGWVWDFTTLTLTQLTNGATGTSLNAPTSCCYYDGYVVMTQKNSRQFWWTGLYSPAVPGLNFASAETAPDSIVGVFTNNEDLWVFTESVTELWYNAADGNHVFERRPGVLLEIGLAAPRTIAKLAQNKIVWLAKSARGELHVVMADGYSPTRISTNAIDQKLAALSADQLSKATAYSYSSEGHSFYCLNVPGLDSTWVYDLQASQMLQTSTWHERTWTNPLTGVESRHRAESVVMYNNQNMVCDYENGNIYLMSRDFMTDDGAFIRRTRVSPHVSAGTNRVFYHSLAIDMKSGIGVVNGTAPVVILQYSNDGGNTWGNEIERDAGVIGNYLGRTIWRQLGSSRDRVFKITMTDPVDWNVIGAYIDMDVGGH